MHVTLSPGGAGLLPHAAVTRRGDFPLTSAGLSWSTPCGGAAAGETPAQP
jgi:hypothetical protein